MARETMKMLAAVAAVGLLGLSAGCGEVMHAGHAALLNAQFDALEKDPDYGPMFAELHTDFPNEWALMRQQVTAGVADLYDGPQIEAKARALSTAFMLDFRRTHLPAAAKASDATLGAIASDQLAMMQGLKAIDPVVCGQISMGNSSGTPPREATRLVSRSGTLILRAVKEGETRPVQRETFSAKDGASLAKILQAQGVTPRQSQLLQYGAASASPAEQCDMGIVVFRAASQLPAPARARFMALTLTTLAGQR